MANIYQGGSIFISGINKQIGGIENHSIDDHIDIDTTNKNNNTSLFYDSSTGKFKYEKAQKIIDEDTEVVIGSGGDFADIYEFQNWISNYRIHSEATVTAKIRGKHQLDETVYWNHPDGRRIILEGENHFDISIVNFNNISGSAGNWTVIVSIDDPTNIETGDIILIHKLTDITNTRATMYLGGFRIINISGNQVTFVIKHNYNIFATGYASGASATILKDGLFMVDNTMNIISVAENSGLNIKYIGFWNGSRIYIRDSWLSVEKSVITEMNDKPLVLINAIGILKNGVSLTNNGYNVYISENSKVDSYVDDGITGWSFITNGSQYSTAITLEKNSYGNFFDIIIYGNGSSNAFPIRSNSCVFLENSNIKFNKGYGLVAYKETDLYINNCDISFNDGGVQLNQLSTIRLANLTNITNNTNIGINAENLSFVEKSNWSGEVANNGTNYSPAKGTWGNGYSYIQILD